jgi:anti-anti-sigma factor
MTELARLTMEQRGEAAVAAIVGEIDSSNAVDLGAEIVAGVPNTAAGLILQLEGTSYLDSAGIRTFCDLHDRLRKRGQQLRAVLPENSPVRRVLVLTEVHRLIPLDASLDRALSELTPRS